MRWKVQIAGDPHSLRLIGDYFVSGPIAISCDAGCYYLEHPDIAIAADAPAAHRAAEKILDSVNGWAIVWLNGFSKVTTRCVVAYGSDGSMTRIHVASATMRGAARLTAYVEPDESARATAQAIVARAAGDGSVQAAFAYLREPLDWETLSKLLDVVEEDVGGERALELKGWARPADLKRFTATANSARAIGIAAQHGWQHKGIPSARMNLREAQSLIRHLASAWLSKR